MKDVSKKQKVILTRGIIVFPSVTSVIEIGREKSLITLKDVKANDEIILTFESVVLESLRKLNIILEK